MMICNDWMSDLVLGLRRVADAAEGIKHREPKALVLRRVGFCLVEGKMVNLYCC